MKTYLAIFTGSEEAREKSGWDDLDEATRSAKEAAGRQAWGAWMQTNADALVVTGGPLGQTKRVSPDGVEDITNALVAYVIIEAESHDAAAKRFEGHPHFTIFPGEAVEVMECLSIPGS